ncbi:MAG: cell division protein FtsQ/DivIB [Caldilineaceae bacterium]
MARTGNSQNESSGDKKSERTVHSVSISRREAPRSTRVNKGGKRSVARGKRRFESAVAQFEVTDRLQRVNWIALRPHGTAWFPAKLAGALLAIAAVAFIGLSQTGDAWFVYAEDVEVDNLSYLHSNDIYRMSGVDGWNIFWLTRHGVRDRIQANPYVESARVDVRLPAKIQIDVAELQPIALWVTKDATYWLTADGVAVPAIASTDEQLPQLIDALGEAEAIGDGSTLAVDPSILASALALMDRLPDLGDKIRYNRNFGLNFPLPDQDIWVYWGDGQDTSTKLENLQAAEALLPELEEPATLIDVRYTHRPYLR